jgi:hypothetical protein
MLAELPFFVEDMDEVGGSDSDEGGGGDVDNLANVVNE